MEYEASDLAPAVAASSHTESVMVARGSVEELVADGMDGLVDQLTVALLPVVAHHADRHGQQRGRVLEHMVDLGQLDWVSRQRDLNPGVLSLHLIKKMRSHWRLVSSYISNLLNT